MGLGVAAFVATVVGLRAWPHLMTSAGKAWDQVAARVSIYELGSAWFVAMAVAPVVFGRWSRAVQLGLLVLAAWWLIPVGARWAAEFASLFSSVLHPVW